MENVQAGGVFTIEFAEGLVNLVSSANVVCHAEEDLNTLRSQCISTSRDFQAAEDDVVAAKSGDNQNVLVDAVERVREVSKRRTTLIHEVEAKERIVGVQQDGQRARQLTFFLDVCHPLLVDAGRMPTLSSPIATSSGQSMSHISRYHSCSNSLDSDSTSRKSDDNDPARSIGAVHCATVREARRDARHFRQRLESVRTDYVLGLAKVVSVYTLMTQDLYDQIYAMRWNGRTAQQVEDAAIHDVLQAEAKYIWSRVAAKNAGIADLPLTPVSLASCTGDGHTGCAGTIWRDHKRIQADDQRRGVRRWARGVARDASPRSSVSSAVWPDSSPETSSSPPEGHGVRWPSLH